MDDDDDDDEVLNTKPVPLCWTSILIQNTSLVQIVYLSQTAYLIALNTKTKEWLNYMSLTPPL